MKRILSTIVFIFLCCFSWAQSFYGDVINSENFDDATSFATSWTQKTSVNTIKWQLANPTSNASFQIIDATSITSGHIRIEYDEKPVITLTKDVSLTGKSGVAIGFYALGLSGLHPTISFTIKVSKDGGSTWDTPFDAAKDGLKGESIGSKWSLYKCFLSSDYNGLASVKIQITFDASKYVAYDTDIYIDNFAVSERYKVDPIITNINYDQKYPKPAGYSNEEPVTIDFKNGGKNDIKSIKMNYQINGGATITETYTPTLAIATDKTDKYSFLKKADLSSPGEEYTIKAWIELEGDGNAKNNTLTGYVENITTYVPYLPAFGEFDEDMWITYSDGWVVEDHSEDGAAWNIDYILDIVTWNVKNQDGDSNTDLISRPIYFETGKTYEIRFDAFTNSLATAAEKLNIMKLFVSDKGNTNGTLTELYSNAAINNKNAINSFGRYKATKTGAHCFVFRCTSPGTADKLMLQHISIVEAKQIDAGVTTLLTPEMNKYEYTKTETVSVKVRNFGITQIAANAVRVKMQLNDGSVISEQVAVAIAPATEITHTFIDKIDPSNQNAPQILKIWTELNADETPDNNMAEYKIESIVTGVPYIPTLENDFRSYWTPVDNNKDYYTFFLRDDPQLSKWAFAYGGSVGLNGVTLLESNEALFSRPIRLSAGNTYKIAYQTRVGKLSMPLKVELYKIDGENKTLVSVISTLTIDNTIFAEKEGSFEIKADGIYKIAYTVEHKIPIDYQIYIGDFKVTRIADYDIEAKESTLITTNISCYNNLQVGILVRNVGTKSINNFTIKAVSTSIGTKEQPFNVEILPNESHLCFFDDRITFDVTDSEELTLSAVSDTDTNLSNNSIVSTLTHVAPAPVPHMGALYSGADMVILNHNKDAYSFKVDLSGSRGMKYFGAKGVVADDEFMSRCIVMKGDAVYSLKFDYMVDVKGDTAQLKVLAYNNATSESYEIVNLKNINNTVKKKFQGYFKAPKDGDYSICFKVYGETESVRLINTFNVEYSANTPDVEVISMDITDEKIFTDQETVNVKIKGVGSANLSSIPVVLDVNGVEYYAIYQSSLSKGAEATVTFNGVNLFTPGDYTIKATAGVCSDLTPLNNTITKTIKSLPLIDLTVLSIDEPKSGSLSAEQQITITVKNSGKGALTNINVSCTVSDTKSNVNGVITGPLNDGETVQYTFSDTFNMYEEKIYNISVTATVDGDINVADNTISTSVICTQAPFDAGVTAISTPVDGLLTANEIVKIKVKNYCTVDLFDVPVKATVGTQTITGSVAKVKTGEEVEYTFTQTVNMVTYGTYTVKASTTLGDDIDNTNDEFVKDVKSWKIDVGIIDVVSPVSGENMGTQQVKVIVKNFGDVAVSNIPVEYKVTTLAQLGTVTSEIAPGATLEFTFPATYNFTDAKTYTITAYTKYALDMDNTNNQFVKEVTNTKKKVDVAIIALVAPISGELTASEAITVTIKNLGEAPINNIPIECDIDGDVTKEEIINSLAIGAEMNYTFTKTYDMSAVKKYNVKIHVKAVDDSNKDNDVIEMIITNAVGVNDIDETLKLSIYPNPVRDILNIEGEYQSLEIYNIAGKIIMRTNGQQTIDVKSLETGVYIIKAYNNNQVGTYKIVK